MLAMEKFICDTVMIIILTVMGCLSLKEPYFCLMIAGILMCLAATDSLKEHRLSPKIKMIMSVVIYIIMVLLFGKTDMPQVICSVIILMGLNVIVTAMEYWLNKYIVAKQQINKAVSTTALNEMYARKLNQELVIKNYLADKNARMEERENISRNIHNSVGHSITAAIMTLDVADMLFDEKPAEARNKMNIANERIRESLQSIRHAVRVLDNDNKFVNISDFICQLSAVVDSFVMDTNIVVNFNTDNVKPDTELPHEHGEFLTGALKELLSNGLRHGQADNFVIFLESDSGHVKIVVKDNGKSDFSEDNRTEKIENGYGLKKLLSYVKKCGGSVSFSNVNGFRTEIIIKLYKENEDE